MWPPHERGLASGPSKHSATPQSLICILVASPTTTYDNLPHRSVSSGVPIKPYLMIFVLCSAFVELILRVCWAHLGPFWVHAGPCWTYLEAMLSHIGPCWGMLGSYWAMLSLCWAYVVVCWASLGLCWAHVGPMLGHVEPKFDNFTDFRSLWKTWKNIGF